MHALTDQMSTWSDLVFAEPFNFSLLCPFLRVGHDFYCKIIKIGSHHLVWLHITTIELKRYI